MNTEVPNTALQVQIERKYERAPRTPKHYPAAAGSTVGRNITQTRTLPLQWFKY